MKAYLSPQSEQIIAFSLNSEEDWKVVVDGILLVGFDGLNSEEDWKCLIRFKEKKRIEKLKLRRGLKE